MTIADTRGISGGSVEPRLCNTWENEKKKTLKQQTNKKPPNQPRTKNPQT